MRLTLKDDGYPFKKIMQGRKWIGRVAKCADGSYLGRIGKLEARANSCIAAFEAVGAQFMGYESADALHSQNARVRRANKLMRQVGDFAVHEYYRGNREPFEKMTADPRTFSPLISAFTRDLKRR